MVDVLRRRAELHADRPAFTFLDGGEGEGVTWTYGELDRRARTIAARLEEEGLREERAVLLFPPGLDYVAAFLGCLFAGVTAVPAYPPGSRGRERLEAIFDDARPRAVLTTDSVRNRVARLFGDDGPPPVSWIETERVEAAAHEGWQPPDLSPDGLAFLQYTSGSTALPRGVRVTHASLLHNEELIGRAFGVHEGSVVVGWLPLYHDMGLIGNVLQPLHAGARCVLMPPLSFLERPRRWLEAISRHGGTISGGPDFAFDLCVRKVGSEERTGLDLSSWVVAFNGSEPVRDRTLARFAAAFEPHGFRRTAFFPCYGLAEATLFVAGGSLARPGALRTVDGGELNAHRVVPVPGHDPSARALVACGEAQGGLDVRIVDPATRCPAPAGRVGEIWVQGPSVAAGYWERGADGTTFGAALAGEDGGRYLRTGDLGFLLDGRLFVTGRLKDLVILRGRNHYPQDLEASAAAAHPGVRAGRCAAFSIEAGGEERLVVVAEVDRVSRGEADTIAAELRGAVAAEHEVQVWDAVVVAPGQVPLTSSGKLRRRACRQAYLGGRLRILARSTLGGAVERSDRADPDLPERSELAELEPEVAEERLARALAHRAARLLGVGEERLDPRRPLVAAGLDSLASAELAAQVEEAYGLRLTPSEILDGMGLEAVARRVLAEPAAAGAARSPAASAPGPHALSYGQRALWFVDRLDPEAAPYNLGVLARVRSPLDTAALRAAVEGSIARHPALRTVFRVADDGPVQEVRAEPSLELVALDGAAWTEEETVGRLTAIARTPFDLEHGPLVRLAVVHRRSSDHRLLFAAHHLLIDYRSLILLATEVAAGYGALIRGERPPRLPAPGGSYLEHVDEERRWLESPSAESDWQYWQRRLDGAPRLDLQTDRSRPRRQTFRGASVARRMAPTVSETLEALAGRHGTTPFVGLLAGFGAVLARHAAAADLVVGTPVDGRTDARWHRTIGYFANPLPLRFQAADETAFSELLAHVRTTTLEALEHRRLPFAVLAERLAPRRDPGRPPLFEVLFVYHSVGPAKLRDLAPFALGEEGFHLRLGDLDLTSSAPTEQGVPFDLVLAAAPTPAGFALSLRYNRDLFDRTTIARLLSHVETFLAAASAEPERSLGELPLLTPPERTQLAYEWNETSAAASEHALLHDAFEARTLQVPDCVAVVHAGDHWTYSELDRRAEAIAEELADAGVGAETVVGVCMERRPALVAALLGVAKAGGAYLPLDPSYPTERLAFMLRDSGADLVISDAASAGRLPPDAPPILMPGRPGPAGVRTGRPRRFADPDHLAYVIYTSGSTGTPKGVAIRHGSAAALLSWALRYFGADELSAVLASTSVCFDLSVFELFAPLAAGGRVVLAPDALALGTSGGRGRVGLVNTVPSAMAELLRAGALPASVRTVALAGEALPASLVSSLLARDVERVVNLYGPTEDTTYSTAARLTAPESTAPPIGHPVAGGRAFLLDRRGRLVPTGAPGELVLGGVGVARGYLNRPALTAERFLPDALSGAPGARLYRTGDRAKRRPDGRLEFQGRLDHQVKIRGFRIEPGEVETVLARHPEVTDCAVVGRADGSGEPYLAAYVVGREGGVPDESELRRALGEVLPAHLVPSRFVPLASLPRTSTGKLNHGALPEPMSAGRESGLARPTAGPAEELLAELWAELLARPRVSRDDDFFALGGHSLLALRLVTRLHRIYGIELPPTAVFEAPTVAELARAVEEASRGGSERRIPPLTARGGDEAPASFGQRRLWFLDRLHGGNAAYSMPAEIELTGELSVTAMAHALSAVAERHPALRTVFEEREEELRQVARPLAGTWMPVIDLERLPRSAARREAGRVVAAEAERPFDLGAGPLMRVRMLRLETGRHLLFVAFHHTVFDGWSMAVFARDVSELYAARVTGRAHRLGPPPVSYGAYAAWQRRWLSDEVIREEVEHWSRHVTAHDAVTLPVDRPRLGVSSQRGAVETLRFAPEPSAALRGLARRTHSTPFLVTLAATAALLGRWSGRERVQVGSPVAGRHRGAVEDTVGFFVNTLVYAADLAGDPGWYELVARVRAAAVAAWSHQDVPFEVLVEKLVPERDLGRHPLFQVVVAEEVPLPRLDLPGLGVEVRRAGRPRARFDLTLLFAVGEGELSVTAEYAEDLYDATTVRRFLGQLRILVETMGGGALDVPLSRVGTLSPAEAHQVAVEWSHGPAAAAGEAVHERVVRQVREHPDRIAVVASDGATVSYGHLQARAAAVARALYGLGARGEAPVAVCCPRGIDLLTAVLAVLEVGGSYVGLDPAAPQERLVRMVRDSGAALLIAPREGGEALASAAGVRIVLPGRGAAIAAPAVSPPCRVDPRQVAYVIYTSGSTGHPKGVAVSHGSLAALVDWHDRCHAVTSDDGATQLASPGFDAAVWEIWPVLASGACLNVPEDDLLRAPDALRRWLEARRVTTMFLPTPLLETLLRETRLPSGVRRVLTGGDRLHPVEGALPVGTVLVNHYGPTEAAVIATAEPVAGGGTEDPPIGRPIDGTRVRVVDRRGRPVPMGVSGELAIGGAGLARGYARRPAATAERFVPDPAGDAGSRLYRTGDLVRWRREGRLDFAGRIDHQVKVRGFRIELGEVESVLAEHPAVAEAAVVVFETPGGRALAAYVSLADEAAESGALLSHLRRRLPEYMVPDRIVALPSLPRTASGKVDRRALPDPGPPSGQTGRTAPRNGVEALLVELWRDVLGHGNVGVLDDFFALGGHSLQISRLLGRIEDTFGVELPVRSVFEARTVADLAELVTERLAAQEEVAIGEILHEMQAGGAGGLRPEVVDG